ncbi:hypothetical protein [Rasiella sp. SM2506]|uniref:hypothetical protein n=1 Tax=Rasiella sp. SM2506 TaxID=3423914 RepID=UPI003D7AACC4
MEILAVFNNCLSIGAILLAILYGIGFTKFDKTYKIFTLYLIFIAVIQILLFVYAYKKVNNLFLFTYYFIGQFLFVSLFYFYLLKKKWMWILTAIVMMGLIVQYILSPSSFINYNSIGVSVTQSIIVFYALLYYYKSLSGKADFLYVNAGILLYFMTSILYFASGNLLMNLNLPKDTQNYIGLSNDIFYLLFLILMFIEWYRKYRVKK